MQVGFIVSQGVNVHYTIGRKHIALIHPFHKEPHSRSHDNTVLPNFPMFKLQLSHLVRDLLHIAQVKKYDNTKARSFALTIETLPNIQAKKMLIERIETA